MYNIQLFCRSAEGVKSDITQRAAWSGEAILRLTESNSLSSNSSRCQCLKLLAVQTAIDTVIGLGRAIINLLSVTNTKFLNRSYQWLVVPPSVESLLMSAPSLSHLSDLMMPSNTKRKIRFGGDVEGLQGLL